MPHSQSTGCSHQAPGYALASCRNWPSWVDQEKALARSTPVHAVSVFADKVEHNASASVLNWSILRLCLLKQDGAALPGQTTPEHFAVRLRLSSELKAKPVATECDGALYILHDRGQNLPLISARRASTPGTVRHWNWPAPFAAKRHRLRAKYQRHSSRPTRCWCHRVKRRKLRAACLCANEPKMSHNRPQRDGGWHDALHHARSDPRTSSGAGVRSVLLMVLTTC